MEILRLKSCPAAISENHRNFEMFNISFAELIVILLLAFLILGPDEMVKVARFFGKLVRKGRKLLWRIRDYVNDEASDAGLDEVKETVSEVKDTIKEADLRKEIRKTETNHPKK